VKEQRGKALKKGGKRVEESLTAGPREPNSYRPERKKRKSGAQKKKKKKKQHNISLGRVAEKNEPLANQSSGSEEAN